MNRGVYEISSAAVAEQTRLEAVAQNLANARTPGYKAARVSFSSQLVQNFPLPGSDGWVAGSAPAIVDAQQTVDFAPGPIVVTGNPLDVAIDGDAFLTVTTPQGARYTRHGTLRVDAEGYLVTTAGDRVQSPSGDIRIGTPGAVEIAEDGSVVVDGKVTDRMKLVTFGAAPSLVPEGDSRFAAGSTAPTVLDAGQVHLTTRAVEEANVDPVSGLVTLVDVQRSYESYMRAIERLDEVAKQAIDQVGRVG
jgi:flagellar basal-body rod protein FlgF